MPVDHEGKVVSPFLLRPLTFLGVDGVVRPDAVAGLEPTDDSSTCWHLRLGDITWSGGAPATADDLVRGIRSISDRPRHRLAAHFDAAPGAVTRVDATTVRVRFRRPTPHAAALLTLPQFAPRAETAKGTLGPYRVAARDATALSLVRAATDPAWFPGLPDRIAFRVIGRGMSVEAFDSGLVDMTTTTGLDLDEVEQFRSRGLLRTQVTDLSGDLLLGPGLLRSSDWRARLRLLRQLTDIDHIRSGREALLLPPAEDADNRPAGTGTGAWTGSGREPTLILPDFAPNRDVVQAATARWREAGIRPVLRELDMATYVATLSSGDYDLAYVLSPLEFPDPIARVLPWLRGGGMARWTGVDNPALDDLVAGHLSGRRPSSMHEIRRTWLAQAPVIPLVRVRANHATRSGAIVPPLNSSGLPAVPDWLAAA